jgi:hypothetical protein
MIPRPPHAPDAGPIGTNWLIEQAGCAYPFTTGGWKVSDVVIFTFEIVYPTLPIVSSKTVYELNGLRIDNSNEGQIPVKASVAVYDFSFVPLAQVQ